VSTGIEVGKRDPFFMKTLQPNFKLLARRVWDNAYAANISFLTIHRG
jgi:hypothetical protein